MLSHVSNIIAILNFTNLSVVSSSSGYRHGIRALFGQQQHRHSPRPPGSPLRCKASSYYPSFTSANQRRPLPAAEEQGDVASACQNWWWDAIFTSTRTSPRGGIHIPQVQVMEQSCPGVQNIKGLRKGPGNKINVCYPFTNLHATLSDKFCNLSLSSAVLELSKCIQPVI